MTDRLSAHLDDFIHAGRLLATGQPEGTFDPALAASMTTDHTTAYRLLASLVSLVEAQGRRMALLMPYLRHRNGCDVARWEAKPVALNCMMTIRPVCTCGLDDAYHREEVTHGVQKINP